MKCYIGVGSNLGDRFANLEKAARSLKKFISRVSSVYSTPALLKTNSPEEWRKPFVNAVLEIVWPDSPSELLLFLKNIESQMGRSPSPAWSPRVIDLDILIFGEQILSSDFLQIPHLQMRERSFVLTPLAQLNSTLRIPGQNQTVLQRARELSPTLPLWMGILNLTPDSFSDGGQLSHEESVLEKINIYDSEHVQILDLGAESTRPQATIVSEQEEWRRLRPALEILKDKYRDCIFRPHISIDTHHAKTAEKACRDFQIDIINDVSGGADPAMLEVLKGTYCQYVLMHNLGIPADPQNVLAPMIDPINEVTLFAKQKTQELERHGIAIDRLIFDPGLGFGKTAHQSLSILKRIHELRSLSTRLLIGASRKSFLKMWASYPPAERDFESLGISLQMAARGVEILRVHEAHLHKRAFQTFQETLP